MIDLTRLMYDDGASRAPMQVKVSSIDDFPGTLVYLGEFELKGRRWAMYDITKLTKDIEIHGWWGKNWDWITCDLPRMSKELWGNEPDGQPGWADGPRPIKAHQINAYTHSLYFEEI